MSRPQSTNPKKYAIQMKFDKDTKDAWDLLPTKMRNVLLKKAIYDIITNLNSHRYDWQNKFYHDSTNPTD